MIEPGDFAQLKQRIAARHAQAMEPVLRGGCADYADYRARTGYLRGMHDALTEIETLERELSDDDDD